MKFKVTMKDPDVLDDAINDAVKAALSDLDLPEDEALELRENRAEKAKAVTKKWFEYGEYLTVEIDTEARTATVCEVK